MGYSFKTLCRTPKWRVVVLNHLYDLQRGICGYCCLNLENGTFEIHHRISRKNGGTDEFRNLVLLHDACHTMVHHLK